MSQNQSHDNQEPIKNFYLRKPRSTDEHYDTLSPNQLGGVYSLTKVGYILEFVRSAEDGTKLAVMSCDKKIAVVTNIGDIDFSPIIKMRQWN